MGKLESQPLGLRVCCPLLSQLQNAKSEQMVCVFHRAQKTGDLGAHRSLWFLKWGGRLPAAARHVGEEMRSLWAHLSPSSLAVWLGRAWPAALPSPEPRESSHCQESQGWTDPIHQLRKRKQGRTLSQARTPGRDGKRFILFCAWRQ